MWLRDTVSTDCPLTSMCASMRVYILIHKQIIKHYFKKELDVLGSLDAKVGLIDFAGCAYPFCGQTPFNNLAISF